MALLAFDLLASIIAARIDVAPPFSALFTLWLSMTQAVGLASDPWLRDTSRRARDECDPACRPSSKGRNNQTACSWAADLWERNATGIRAQHIHETVHDFPRINRALTSATFGRWNNRLDVRPLIVRRIARIAQLVTIVFQAVFGRPHWRPPSNQAAANESQMIHPIQLLPGRTQRRTCTDNLH